MIKKGTREIEIRKVANGYEMAEKASPSRCSEFDISRIQVAESFLSLVEQLYTVFEADTDPSFEAMMKRIRS